MAEFAMENGIVPIYSPREISKVCIEKLEVVYQAHNVGFIVVRPPPEWKNPEYFRRT